MLEDEKAPEAKMATPEEQEARQGRRGRKLTPALMVESKAKTEKIPVFAFPHYVGPGTRNVTTALLYHGRIGVILPGWLTDRPITTFLAVGERSTAKRHQLEPYLRQFYSNFELAQKQALREVDALKPLGNHIGRVFMSYSGTQDAYDSWAAVREPCLSVILPVLSENPLERCTASVELLWRVWEYSLQIGNDPDLPGEEIDPDPLLDFLDQRSKIAGSPYHLLAECALNRYSVPRYNALSLVTDSDAALGVLTYIGQQVVGPDEPETEERLEALSFFLFDRITFKHVPPLRPNAIAKVAELMARHEDALVSLRRRCRAESLELLGGRISNAYLRDALSSSLDKLEEEVSEVLGINRAAVKAHLSQLAQDHRVWTVIAGLLASTGKVPNMVTASLGLTALSLVGAGAVKAGMNRRQQLAKSPMRFVYYATRSTHRRKAPGHARISA